jgi:hypothetical protein
LSDLRLVPGSVYRITSAGGEDTPIVTEGRFQGLTSIGSIDALVLEVKDGKKTRTRLLPTHAVLALDILEQAARPKDEKDDTPAHYV